MNPGLAYVAGAWQVAAEAIVPINSDGGRTIGMRAHLFLFLDDLFPCGVRKTTSEPMRAIMTVPASVIGFIS